jgi:transposase
MKQQHSWEITDAFWEAAREYRRKPGGGRPARDFRRVLEAVFYVPHTGIQWKALPKAFGVAGSIHRYFWFWCEQGVFKAL